LTRQSGTDPQRPGLWVGLLLLACLGFGCRTAAPPVPVDLSAPGWRVQQGQAVWKPGRHRVELTGELLFATRTNGDFFVQFAKPPFPLATASVLGNDWRIEFGSGQYSARGQGDPPARFAWFQLPAALAGNALAAGWQFERLSADSSRLINPRSGEALETAFFP